VRKTFYVLIALLLNILIGISYAQQNVRKVNIEITNPLDPTKTAKIYARPDSGKEMLILPNEVIEALGLEKIEEVRFSEKNEVIRQNIYGPVRLKLRERIGTFDVLAGGDTSKVIGKSVLERLDYAIDSSGALSSKKHLDITPIKIKQNVFFLKSWYSSIVGKGNWEPSFVSNLGAYYVNGDYSLFSAGAGFGLAYNFNLRKEYPIEFGFYIAPQASGDSLGDNVFVSGLAHLTFARAIGVGLGWRVWTRGQEFHMSNFKRSNAFFTLGYNLTNEKRRNNNNE
jgi:predicted aspartyl protease